MTHSVLGNTAAYFLFCFRKISFTLSPTWPDTNFTSPSRDECKSSQWKIWEALWPVCDRSGVQRGWCHSARGWHTVAVQKGRSKPDNSLPTWPCGYQSSECSIIMLFSVIRVFLQLGTPVVFNISCMERRTYIMSRSNSLAFLIILISPMTS